MEGDDELAYDFFFIGVYTFIGQTENKRVKPWALSFAFQSAGSNDNTMRQHQ